MRTSSGPPQGDLEANQVSFCSLWHSARMGSMRREAERGDDRRASRWLAATTAAVLFLLGNAVRQPPKSPPLHPSRYRSKSFHPSPISFSPRSP
jgi:hypothetical protein